VKELSITYQKANYTIQYEFKDTTRFIRAIRSTIGLIDYRVIFDDLRLKEQFGNPFEFSTTGHPNFDILLPDKSASWNMADAVIRGIVKIGD
jgi:hypothetical protein